VGRVNQLVLLLQSFTSIHILAVSQPSYNDLRIMRHQAHPLKSSSFLTRQTSPLSSNPSAIDELRVRV
jgi:hypothetical protein